MNYMTNPSQLQDERDLALLISRSLLFGDWIDHDGIWPWKRLKFSLPNEVFYCRCLITNDKEHYIDQTSSHTMMQSRKWLYSLLRGKTAGKLISWEVRHDQRGPNDIPDAPQTPHHGTNFSNNFHDAVFHFGNPRQAWSKLIRIKMSRSKDSKFWTLADR